MIYISSLLLFICCLTVSIECRRECINSDDVSFQRKVRESPLVIYGRSIVKSIDPIDQNLFNVTIRVQCILKGSQTPRTINITNAGWAVGRKYCQDLAVGEEYIVFLQYWLNDTYTSMDFEEVPYEGKLTADSLFKNTCNLTRLSPYNISNNVNECPTFSTSSECNGTSNNETSTTTIPSFGLKEHRVYQNSVVFTNNSTAKTSVGQGSTLPVLRIATSKSNVTNDGHLSHPLHTANDDLKNIQSKLPAHGDDRKNKSDKQNISLFVIISAIFISLLQ